MEYLKMFSLMILNVVISLGVSFGVYKYLTTDLGSGTGSMGVVFESFVIAVVVFLIVLIVVGSGIATLLL